MHLMKHVGHFPMGSGGAAQMNSVVTEHSDQYSDVTDDIARQKVLITADNIQVGWSLSQMFDYYFRKVKNG